MGKTCSGNGDCDSDFATETYECDCVAGYEGRDCQTNINECAPIPCKNSATCTDGLNSYTCRCNGRWKGTTCEDPWTCKCPHGTLGNCLQGADGSEDCSACGEGYYLKDQKCIEKGLCPQNEHDTALTGETNCQPNVCLCDNGDAQNPCEIHQDRYCVACDRGYHTKIADDKICAPNVCACAYGTARTGRACTEHNSNLCHSCDSTYHLDSLLACSANVCSCQNGITVSECLSHNQETCAKCDSGFKLEFSKCNPIENKRGDITYAITIRNPSLTNAEIESERERVTGFRHKVVSRVTKTVSLTKVKKTKVKKNDFTLSETTNGSEETVTLEAFDDKTKIQSVYFVIIDLLNQGLDSDIFTIKMFDEPGQAILNGATLIILACLSLFLFLLEQLIKVFACLGFVVLCVFFYKMCKKHSKITTNQYSALTTKDNLEDGLLQDMNLKF